MDRAWRRAVHKGCWRRFEAARPALLYYGPRIPLYAERLQGLSEEEVTLDVFRSYRPPPESVRLVADFVESRSTEGPRASGTDCWLLRPSS